jgi:hypothetical protein
MANAYKFKVTLPNGKSRVHSFTFYSLGIDMFNTLRKTPNVIVELIKPADRHSSHLISLFNPMNIKNIKQA